MRSMDDEFAFHVNEYEDRELARSIIKADLAHSLKTGSTLSSVSTSLRAIAGRPSGTTALTAAWASL